MQQGFVVAGTELLYVFVNNSNTDKCNLYKN